MGYVVGDLRASSGYGEVWFGVPVWCYTECNKDIQKANMDVCANMQLNVTNPNSSDR